MSYAADIQLLGCYFFFILCIHVENSDRESLPAAPQSPVNN